MIISFGEEANILNEAMSEKLGSAFLSIKSPQGISDPGGFQEYFDPKKEVGVVDGTVVLLVSLESLEAAASLKTIGHLIDRGCSVKVFALYPLGFTFTSAKERDYIQTISVNLQDYAISGYYDEIYLIETMKAFDLCKTEEASLDELTEVYSGFMSVVLYNILHGQDTSKVIHNGLGQGDPMAKIRTIGILDKSDKVGKMFDLEMPRQKQLLYFAGRSTKKNFSSFIKIVEQIKKDQGDTEIPVHFALYSTQEVDDDIGIVIEGSSLLQIKD